MYKLTYCSPLFEHEGLLKKKDSKSTLITELGKEENFNSQGEMDKDVETCFVIVVMLVVRKMWKGCAKFKDLADKFHQDVMNEANVYNTTAIIVVFDSYSKKIIENF